MINMKFLAFLCLILGTCFLVHGQGTSNLETSRIQSVVDSSQSDNMVLTQIFAVNVPIDSVWNAYTSKVGWESWAAAKAEVDFKIGGLIRTNYNTDGEIGDSSTIVLHVINYVPKRMLTLQAELGNNFPQFMLEDAEDLYNMVLFEELGPSKTKVVSYGIGYKKTEDYLKLMKFFVQGNEQSYLNLIYYLETGKASAKY